MRATALVAIGSFAMSGCSTIVTYHATRNVNDPAQTVRYDQGVGTIAVKSDANEIFMYPAFKAQPTAKEPTFVLGYANNGTAPIDFSSDNVKAYFRGAPVPIYTYAEKLAQIQAEKRGQQVALAVVGALAAGAAAYSASHQTYTNTYSGRVHTRYGGASYWGSNTVKVYDPLAGILVGGAIAGGTAYGINQIEYNAKNLEEAAGGILQQNTIDPQRMITGNIILKDCCDLYTKPDDAIRIEVTANGRTSSFDFKRTITAK
jgi:hypothetical protein